MENPGAILLPLPPDAMQDAANLSQSAAQKAHPMTIMTPPMSNTKQAEFRVFVCTIHNASFFRPDGKKLPFIRGYLKTNVIADIAYCDNEVDGGNIYIRRGTEDDIVTAEAVYDPMAHLKHRTRKQVEQELKDDLTIQIRAELLREMADAKKLGGVDQGAKAANVTANGPQNVVMVPRINPVSSTDIATGTAGASAELPLAQREVGAGATTLDLSPAAKAAAILARINATAAAEPQQ